MRRNRAIAWGSAALLLAATGCGGGGGGGGGGGEALCAIPAPVVLAATGEEAPDTNGGTFGFFGPDARVVAAAGGWTAFVADVEGGDAPRGVFAAAPTDGPRLVWTVGESGDPRPVREVLHLAMARTGVLAAVVDYLPEAPGSEPMTAILTARLTATGDVVEDVVAFATADPFVVRQVEVAGNDDVFFLAEVATGLALYRMDRFGDALEEIAATGLPAPGFPEGAVYGDDFGRFSVDDEGGFLAFTANAAPGTLRAIFATDFSTVAVVAADGEPAPGGRTFEDVYEPTRPLIATSGAGVSMVAFAARLDGEPAFGAYLARVFPTLEPIETLFSPDEPVPGGAVVDVRLSSSEAGADAATVLVRTEATTVAYDVPMAGTLLQAMLSSDPAPGGSGAPFSAFPSLDDGGAADTDAFGRFAFSSVLEDGTSGVFWYVPDCGLSALAVEGATYAPDAAFGSLAGSVVAVAGETVAFTATTVAGGDALSTALFRARLR
jgi:hypothetical protein